MIHILHHRYVILAAFYACQIIFHPKGFTSSPHVFITTRGSARRLLRDQRARARKLLVFCLWCRARCRSGPSGSYEHRHHPTITSFEDPFLRLHDLGELVAHPYLNGNPTKPSIWMFWHVLAIAQLVFGMGHSPQQVLSLQVCGLIKGQQSC